MKKYYRFLRREDGAELIEAALLYPFVLLVLGGLIYTGLFILQYMTVGAYAQKVALLAAREVAYPGYIEIMNNEKLSTTAIEVELDDYSKGAAATAEDNQANGYVITFSTDANEVMSRAYRFWLPDPLKPNPLARAFKKSDQYDPSSKLAELMHNMVDKYAILTGKNKAEVTITCNNYIVSQNVVVDVKQDLTNSQLLTALGVEQPCVHVSATASANDTDEFVRNTDFVIDAIKMIAKKLHLDVDDVAKKVNDVKKTLGLD